MITLASIGVNIFDHNETIILKNANNIIERYLIVLANNSIIASLILLLVSILWSKINTLTSQLFFGFMKHLIWWQLSSKEQ